MFSKNRHEHHVIDTAAIADLQLEIMSVFGDRITESGKISEARLFSRCSRLFGKPRTSRRAVSAPSAPVMTASSSTRAATAA
jgi:hypothetical protein